MLEEHPLCGTGGHLREAGVGPWWVDGDDFTDGGTPGRSRRARPCHVLQSITQGLHVSCGTSSLESPTTQAERGVFRAPGSASLARLGAARARGGGARLGWGSCGREAPLPPAPWFVPSTFALPNFNVRKYLLKNRRFVKIFWEKKSLSRVSPDVCSEGI